MIFGLAAQWKEKRYTLNCQEGMEILFFVFVIHFKTKYIEN